MNDPIARARSAGYARGVFVGGCFGSEERYYMKGYGMNKEWLTLDIRMVRLMSDDKASSLAWRSLAVVSGRIHE